MLEPQEEEDDDKGAALLGGGIHKVELPYKEPHVSLSFKIWQHRWDYVVCVVVCCLFSHALFLHGQIVGMFDVNARLDTNFTIISTNEIGTKVLKAFNLSVPYEIDFHFLGVVSKFTYWDAITGLWGELGFARFCAILLVLFSAIWPHLKLVLLQIYFHIKVDDQHRRTAFYWLDTFGKFSLADVFLVCCLLAVLDVIFEISLPPIVPSTFTLAGLFNDQHTKLGNSTYSAVLNELFCDELESCSSKASCAACYLRISSKNELELGQYLETFQGSPSLLSLSHALRSRMGNSDQVLTATGSISFGIFVSGLPGLYTFCAGVLVSLILSCVITEMDFHFIRSPLVNHFSMKRNSQDHISPDDETPMLLEARLQSKCEEANVSTTGYTHRFFWVKLLMSALVLIFVLLGSFLLTFQRDVEGSIAQVIKAVLGIDLDREYSLSQVAKLTGQQGGSDSFLEFVFLVFVLICPIARAVLTLVLLGLPMKFIWHKRVAYAVNVLGSFSAWEVFSVAVILLQIEIPPITATIISEESVLCKALHLLPGLDEECFDVHFSMNGKYTFVWLGFLGMLLVSNVAVRMLFRAVNPRLDDMGGPYCGVRVCCDCCDCCGVCCPVEAADALYVETHDEDTVSLNVSSELKKD